MVGSRTFRPRARVFSVIDGLPAGTIVVSGGARGPDRWAVERALENGMPIRVHPAQWDRYGRAAGFIRNALVVQDCDQLIAFWDGSSRGTADVVAKAQDAGKPVTVVRMGSDP